MSRSENEMSRFDGTNERDGTRARIRDRDIVPVPIPVPFCPPNVPVPVQGGEAGAAATAEQPVPSGKAGVLAMWQLIASGGWWAPGEIAEALGMPKASVHSRLQSMKQCGYVVRRAISLELRVRRRGRPECVEYAVNNDCIVPSGLTAKQVLDALNGATA